MQNGLTNLAVLLLNKFHLLLLNLQMPLHIPALIIVIAFYMIFQSIPFIACKKYKILLLVLLHVPLVHHVVLSFSYLHIGYLLNTVLTLNCVALLIVHSHEGNLIISTHCLFPD